MHPQELKTWLSCGQVADTYKLNRRNVNDTCNKAKFTEGEAVNTALGWLISPEAAKRVWGYRITKEK